MSVKKSDKGRQSPTKRKQSNARALRNTTIISGALQGKSTSAIAAEVGVSRQTVSGVLNSEEVKTKIGEIDRRLAEGIDSAIITVLKAVKGDYYAARDLLRNFGAMRAKIELDADSVPKLAELLAASWESEEVHTNPLKEDEQKSLKQKSTSSRET